MSGAEALGEVTLRPWPAPKKEGFSKQELLRQIEQLTAERGHLRDITEESLQEDIDAGKDVPDDAAATAEAKKDDKDAPSKEERLQAVYRAQQEISGHLDWAKFAASNAIDLISLILSADPNKRAVESFSQTFRHEGLNQGVPFGSFGLSKENHEQHVRKPEEAASLQFLKQRQELVAKGARMDALDTATNEILQAAKNLEREVRRETKYWKEIVSISDKGWPIQRVRQNARNVPFAVRYGLPEASNHFRTRGLAPLRMDKDGSIILDPALALKPKTLRVRVSENGRIMGTSHLLIDTETTDMVIEKSIQLARDSLFEEELYHEISLETRQLSKYGVEFRDSVIQVNAPDTSTRQRQRKLLIDCIPRNEHIASGQDTSYDWLAQNVAEGLRLLLAHEHSMRLHRRSQLPSPLNAKKKERQQPPLLRTLLAVLKHLDGVDSLYGYLEATTKSLSSAGITIGLETTREISWAKLADDLRSSTNTDLSATDRLLDIFLKPFDGKATLTLPSLNGAQAESLVVTTRTIVGAPTYGTEHKVTFPASLTADLGLFQQSKHSTVKEVQSHLDMILSLHLAHRQLKSNFAPKTVIKDREANITILSKESIKGPKGDRDIEVLLKEGQLTVIATPTDSEKATEDEQDLYVWDGKTGHASLEEKIASWVG